MTAMDEISAATDVIDPCPVCGQVVMWVAAIGDGPTFANPCSHRVRVTIHADDATRSRRVSLDRVTGV